MKSYTFKIGGPAGLGIMTTGLIFSKSVSRCGFHIFDYVEYPSLIRGGHNVMEVRFSQEEVFCQEKGADLLIALNKESIDLHKDEIKKGGGVMIDPDQVKVDESEYSGIKILKVPFLQILKEIGAPKIMEDNVSLGVAFALFGMPIDALLSAISDIFADKGQEIITSNQKAARHGYEFAVKAGFKLEDIPKNIPSQINKEKAVLTGNEAVALGAISAGCQFYCAYPMTPSSSLLHYLAEKAEKVGMVVRHAEDEIGVINEAIGASFAGVRAMVGTSGGGFALMNEAVSLSGITETGAVIFVGQRPGPATGMPTWTEQGDLLFIIRSGHGEFPKIVLTPGDVEEAVNLTKKAFNLADIYQTPVFVVSDKYLAESHKSAAIANLKLQISKVKIDRGKLEIDIQNEGEVKTYPRYKDTEDGISPRVLPGAKGYYYQANSYEHVEDGHTSESAEVRTAQVEKRARKIKTYLKNHFQPPVLFGPADADATLVGWGSTKGPIRQAMKECSMNYLHFTHVWPLDGEKVKQELVRHKRLILVENNFTGQLGQLIRQETGVEIKEKILKYNGRPFYVEDILEGIK